MLFNHIIPTFDQIACFGFNLFLQMLRCFQHIKRRDIKEKQPTEMFKDKKFLRLVVSAFSRKINTDT